MRFLYRDPSDTHTLLSPHLCVLTLSAPPVGPRVLLVSVLPAHNSSTLCTTSTHPSHSAPFSCIRPVNACTRTCQASTCSNTSQASAWTSQVYSFYNSQACHHTSEVGNSPQVQCREFPSTCSGEASAGWVSRHASWWPASGLCPGGVPWGQSTYRPAVCGQHSDGSRCAALGQGQGPSNCGSLTVPKTKKEHNLR